MPPDLETIVSLCKRRGFIFGGSEIYGGLGGFWDYGPLGVELKNNIKRAWWRAMVQERDDIAGIDAAVIMNANVWRASGHATTFNDLMVECVENHHRLRADKVQGDRCPECGSRLGEPRPFNTMFKTHVGAVEDDSALVWLRPETAQGILVNFQNVQQAMRKKIPFGIAQIGKAFRNEVQTGNFIFRDREFEQMEMEFFVKPGTEDGWHDYWREARLAWWQQTFNIDSSRIRIKVIRREDKFPMGWSEIEGIASRTDYDLTNHQQWSGKDLGYFDDETKEKYLPFVVEPAMGVDRAVLVALIESYREEKVKNEKRTVLHFPYALAPIKAAVLPLLRNRPEIVALAQGLTADLKRSMMAVYDDTGSIGRLYRRQDEIGTIWCVTVDVQTLEDKQVTVRERDTMQQVRIPLNAVKEYLTTRLT